jgi:hypothetical protein
MNSRVRTAAVGRADHLRTTRRRPPARGCCPQDPRAPAPHAPTPAGRGRPRRDEPPLALARAHLDSAVHGLAALVRHGNRREQQCAIERRVEFPHEWSPRVRLRRLNRPRAGIRPRATWATASKVFTCGSPSRFGLRTLAGGTIARDPGTHIVPTKRVKRRTWKSRAARRVLSATDAPRTQGSARRRHSAGTRTVASRPRRCDQTCELFNSAVCEKLVYKKTCIVLPVAANMTTRERRCPFCLPRSPSRARDNSSA